MALTATIYAATLALRDAVDAADRTHLHRSSLFLRLCEGDAEGWAECATASVRGPDATTDEVLDALAGRVLGVALEGVSPLASATTSPVLAAARVSRQRADLAAAGLVDASVLDLRLRAAGVSLAEHLGADATSIGFAGVVGVADAATSRARATALVELGASRVRVKVSPTSGTQALEAVLDAIGVPVVADANGSLRPAEDSAVLAALGALPLAWIEQPFAQGNLAGHAALAASCAVPIGLDESITSVRAVRDAARYAAASVLCLKPVRLGGIVKVLEVQREAARLGLRTYVGGYFEAGLGRAVLGALASAGPDDLDGDVAAPSTYLVSDPCGLDGPVRGRQPVFAGPGCGPPPRPSSLELRLERSF